MKINIIIFQEKKELIDGIFGWVREAWRCTMGLVPILSEEGIRQIESDEECTLQCQLVWCWLLSHPPFRFNMLSLQPKKFPHIFNFSPIPHALYNFRDL